MVQNSLPQNYTKEKIKSTHLIMLNTNNYIRLRIMCNLFSLLPKGLQNPVVIQNALQRATPYSPPCGAQCWKPWKSRSNFSLKFLKLSQRGDFLSNFDISNATSEAKSYPVQSTLWGTMFETLEESEQFQSYVSQTITAR